ncbi:6-bladed beta-propeller [Pleomorphovibrio marinus]|uniref:6-bladed beta-propeller n=1 Tax=Pleomorphovibrio marinus TaxID=2164132 RepID=UPI000E0AB4B1|nr:6-bladed beta-propeller [Pleomorphovibrio marinus]
MKAFLYLLVIGLLTSCGQNTAIDTLEPILPLRFEEAENADIAALTDSIGFIALDNNPEAYFTDIAKLSAKNGHFYLMETFSQTKGLLVFDGEGNFIRSIGEIGEGPGKMRRPTDFDIFSDGSVVFLDRDLRRLFFYSSEGEFQKTSDLSFPAISFVHLKDGGWLFSANIQDTTSYKVVKTHAEFLPIEYHFPYAEEEKQIMLSYGNFHVEGPEILYHRPFSDTLSIFSETGNLTQQVKLDFGKESPPVEALYDFQKMSAYQNKVRYSYLLSRPVITEDYIVGMYSTTFNEGVVWLFARKSGKLNSIILDMDNYTFKNIYRPLTVLHEKGIVSHMMPEVLAMEKNLSDIPQNIQEHLADEGHVLVVHYLKE